MRILHLEAGRHLFGGARQAALLIAELERRGLRNKLVCPPEQPILDKLPASVRQPMPIAGELDPLFVGRLIRRMRRFQADVLHVHSRRGADWVGAIAAGLTGVPAVLTRRVESQEPALGLRLKCRPYRAIAAISEAVVQQMTAAGIDAGRLTRIPSAVDASVWAPDPAAGARLRAQCDLPADSIVIATIAQLIPRKGIETIIDALVKLPESCAKVVLLCFGRGPQRPLLERKVRDAGLARRVHFMGYRDDLPALLAGVDIVVQAPSREGLGAAILESMSAGRSVLATAVGGITDLITTEQDGILVPPGDAAALAVGLERLVHDPALRRRLGQAARRRVQAEFSVRQMTDAYLALYRQIATVPDGVLRF